jgi:hypothetical protein
MLLTDRKTFGDNSPKSGGFPLVNHDLGQSFSLPHFEMKDFVGWTLFSTSSPPFTSGC